MKKALLFLALLVALPSPARAHIGSPNVFFEGRAGTYSLSAVVRPPPALPGALQVSVRSDAPGLRTIFLLPVIWQAGRAGSPLPVRAQRVPGETNLWSAEVWLLRPGSYSLQILADGSNGPGEATVPVNALGIADQRMPTTLRLMLLLYGLALVVAAVLVVQAIARDAWLPPGECPTARDTVRGFRVALIVLIFLVTGVAASAVLWHDLDLAFRRNSAQKPKPINATVHMEERRAVLELHPSPEPGPGASWAGLVPEHGKLLHLFLVRAPNLDVFAHLHPQRLDEDTFALELPALPAGGYELYGEVTYENGFNQTLVANVALPQQAGRLLGLPILATNVSGEVLCGYPGAPPPKPGKLMPDPDDSWEVNRAEHTGANRYLPTPRADCRLVAPLFDGNTLVFENAAAAAAGSEAALRFAAFGPDGHRLELQSYMGMLGHAALRSANGAVFAHLHPGGSFSMAAQEAFRNREGLATPDPPGAPKSSRGPQAPAPLDMKQLNQVAFPYEFPQAGRYRLWVQVRISGRVQTGVFDLEVKRL